MDQIIIKNIQTIFNDKLMIKDQSSAIKSMLHIDYTKEITNNTHWLINIRNKSITWSERLYCILNNIVEINIPKCLICGKPSSFHGFSEGYSQSCGKSCGAKLRCKKELELYNGKYRFQTDEFKIKNKETCLLKYNVKNVFQNSDIKNKQKQTMLDKYNVENCSSLDWVKKKKIITSQKNWGSDYPWQSAEISEKVKDKIKELYGKEYENISQVPEIKMRRLNTFMDRYNRNNPNDVRIVNEEDVDNGILIDYFNRNCRMVYKKGICKIVDSYQFKNLDYEYSWECLKCGEIFQCSLSDFDYHPGHLKCFNKHTLHRYYSSSSKMENELYEFCKLYFDDVIKGDRKIIHPQELDIYIPSKNLAIEFNGLYWHSELCGGKSSHYHILKTNKCQAKDIQLIHIFEDEWIYKKEIVLSVLKYKLGLCDKNIYARKCEIVDLKFKEYKEFLEINHMQGCCSGKLCIGLKYNNKLVSILLLGAPRFNKNYQWEILRSCSKLNTSVVGGHSKLFKHFVKNYFPKSVITYADRRYGEGLGYLNCGFKSVGSTDPNYFYMDNYMYRQNRWRFQKKSLKSKLEIFDSTLSEWTNMQLNGYDRIWDCGNNVYTWEIS